MNQWEPLREIRDPRSNVAQSNYGLQAAWGGAWAVIEDMAAF